MSRVASTLVCIGLLSSVGACGKDKEGDPQTDSGTGGSPSGTGGSPNGTGGSPEQCNEDLPTGVGGAIYINNCPEWIGEPLQPSEFVPEEELGALDVSCSAGGRGGEGGEASASDRPLLEKLCRATETLGDATLIECLRGTLSSPCSEQQENAVYDCIRALKPCAPNETQCTELIQECPELNESLCFWGMRSAEGRGRTDEVRQCMAAKPTSEACDDAFLRCQWGL